MNKTRTHLIVLSVTLLASLIGNSYQWYGITVPLQDTLARATQTASDLASRLQTAELDNAELVRNLTSERERNEAFANQINDISGTVGKLDKLSKLDQELLQKYSKVYFLNENYTPAPIKQIPEDLTYNKQEEYLHAHILPFLEKMIADAADDDIDLSVLSGYRSFDTQAILKAGYKVTYGSGANAFSADQGYSEHQLGTTIDFSTKVLGGGLNGFEKTDAFAWLEKNAHKYGFTLSYPHNNTYYQFEPWHWRFVGKDLARDLHNDEKHFYDLDQRDIDTYLIGIFE